MRFKSSEFFGRVNVGRADEHPPASLHTFMFVSCIRLFSLKLAGLWPCRETNPPLLPFEISRLRISTVLNFKFQTAANGEILSGQDPAGQFKRKEHYMNVPSLSFIYRIYFG
jgi:hypothetical protein